MSIGLSVPENIATDLLEKLDAKRPAGEPITGGGQIFHHGFHNAQIVSRNDR